MTFFRLHDDFPATAVGSRFTLSRAPIWLAATLKTVHEAIVVAKTRRLQRELMFHTDLADEALDLSSDRSLNEQDVRKVPQRPMILGDKWDF